VNRAKPGQPNGRQVRMDEQAGHMTQEVAPLAGIEGGAEIAEKPAIMYGGNLD